MINLTKLSDLAGAIRELAGDLRRMAEMLDESTLRHKASQLSGHASVLTQMVIDESTGKQPSFLDGNEENENNAR